jgi:hypothetical protein
VIHGNASTAASSMVKVSPAFVVPVRLSVVVTLSC